MRLTSRGLRETESGTEAIEDQTELAILRKQARRVVVRTCLLAVLGTVVLYGLPL